MNVLRTLILCILVIACAAAQAPAEPDPILRAKTLELLEAIGVRDQTGEALDKQLAIFSGAHPEVPHEFWRAQREKHVEAKLMMHGMAIVIEKRFSPDEIQALLDFYSGPVGKRMLLLRLELGKTAKQLGRQLGDAFQRDVRRELEAGGYIQ